ncbi:MAG: glycosyltransferase family 39 protein [Chloroflexi bacterium]|nr:glycosyltransferase family 39 protein [Chloroflexota bacterium]
MMRSRRNIRFPALDSWGVTLFIVLLAALAVRLYGIDWDDGADLHPDELFVAKIVLIDRIRFEWPPDLGSLVDPARSGLNPRSADPVTGQFREFAYGALPLWVTDATAWFLSRITGTNWNSMERAYLVGRAISAVLSALTIVPVAVMGVSLGGRSVGLLAALFAAFAPMSIQLAHFYTTDSWLTFFVALCLLSCVQAAKNGSNVRFAAAGATFGLALATKGSVFTLAAPIAIALLIAFLRDINSEEKVSVARRTLIRTVTGASAAAVAFFAFEPYALLRPGVYLQSLKTQADIVSGVFDVPFTRVYAGTFPVAYLIQQVVRWGYGPAAGVLSVVGIILLLGLAFRRASTSAFVLASWVAAYGIVLVVADVKFLRYLEPLAPVFAITAALSLTRLTRMIPRFWPSVPRAAIPVAALALAFGWTAAFLSIYAHENSRLAASRWIYGTIAPGSVLTAEYWDDALPRTLSFSLSPAAFGFGTLTLDLYRDLPPPEASAELYEGISRADFIIQSSERVESAMRAAPWRYPIQGRYFEKLEDGELGFELVAQFARSPTIGNVAIDDRGADESFINYDHPRVSVFGRTGPISRGAYDAEMSWALGRPWYPAREPDQATLLLDGPVGENPSVNDARWSATLTSATPVAVAVWILFLIVLLAAGLPIARLLLPMLPDHGWGLARILCLVVAAYPVWLGASLELFRFRAVWVVLSLVAVGLTGWWLRARTGWPRDQSATSRAWVHAEVTFWLVFLLFLGYRLANPDGWHPFWGGEKPMEFAQINAIARSAYFPPYDPWYADGYVNYYYYGFYLVAFLFKSTGIPAEIGFNLALPAMMGMLASGGFSVAAALARAVTRPPRLTMLGGWAGAVSLCLLGNLSALRGIFGGVPARFDPFLFWTWSGSRAMDNVITEFPYFTGLYADLHAHVVALPITVAAIAICIAVATSPLSVGLAALSRLGRASWARLTILALLLGTLSATNAWDVPVYAVLAVVSVFMATCGVTPLSRRLFTFIAASALVLGGAWLLFLPFHLHFVALFSQVALVGDPSDLIQFLSHLGGQIVVCSLGLTALLLRRDRDHFSPWPWPLVVFAIGVLGLVAARLGSGPLVQVGASILLVGALSGPPMTAAWRLVRDGRCIAGWSVRLQQLTLVAVPVIAVGSVLAGRSVFAMLFALGSAAALGWLRLSRSWERLVCLLLAAGLFTAAGAEIVVVADDLIGTSAYRMNTVFKFYNQVWVLLSLAGSGLLALMIQEARLPRRSSSATRRSTSGRPAWARFGVAAAALFVLAAMTYPVLATGPRLAQRFSPGTPAGSLNALGWMHAGTVPVLGDPLLSEITFAGDAAAIEWFFANVEGSPVIAEASIGPYRCNGSRISSATGLPTIIGWERHEQQQRYPDTLSARVEDVRTLYTSSDPEAKASILRRYNVEYVVVGDLERLYPIANNECTPTGSPEGIAGFDAMLGTTLEVAHSAHGTTIYRVLPVRAN